MSRRTKPARRRRDEAGYVAVVGAVLVAFLILPLAALSVDIGRIYVEIERVQNAADAAATAGVTFLPDDFASAKATALAVASRNGYPNSGTSSVVVTVGAKPTQLKVTVHHTIGNSFGAAFGANYADVSRSAVADYNGPAPMGSPCNTFGNEPPGTVLRGPSTSVIHAPPGGAECTSTPRLWAAIAGPETPKGNGDQFSTRKCDTSVATDGCTGNANHEFDPRGYFYLVRVSQAAVTAAQPITIQVFDPAFVENGDKCEVGPKEVESDTYPLANNMNPYTPADGVSRYQSGVSNFCTGDVLTTTTSEAPTTSFGLRLPTDTYQPVQGTPITTCNKQFPGYVAANTTTKMLRSKKKNGNTNDVYKESVAQVYRQWVDLCTFTPTKVGDHYLQVRTNVKLGGTSDTQGGFDGNPAVFNQAGDDPTVKGSGSNRFALRVKGAVGGTVSVAGWDHMSIYANYSGATSDVQPGPGRPCGGEQGPPGDVLRRR